MCSENIAEPHYNITRRKQLRSAALSPCPCLCVGIVGINNARLAQPRDCSELSKAVGDVGGDRFFPICHDVRAACGDSPNLVLIIVDESSECAFHHYYHYLFYIFDVQSISVRQHTHTIGRASLFVERARNLIWYYCLCCVIRNTCVCAHCAHVTFRSPSPL